MNTSPQLKEKLTIQECINRLETLFKSYQKDSEFNYQLSVSNSPFNTLKRYAKALVVLKDLFDFDFALRFPSNQPMLRIENKRTNEYWEIPITQEKYDLIKEVFG